MLFAIYIYKLKAACIHACHITAPGYFCSILSSGNCLHNVSHFSTCPCLVSSNLTKTFHSQINYSKLPLGVKECVYVCMVLSHPSLT